MAELPSASVVIDDEAGAFAGGTGYAIVIAPVATNADTTPRVFASAKGILDQHGYSPGADYAALHLEGTKKPVIFVGVPIATAGAIKGEDTSGVTGTSVVSSAVGASGAMEELDVVLTVTTGGTIGTTGIVLSLSVDGGWTEKTIRLGTATSYAIPYMGVTISFAAGTLVAGDVYKFRTTEPMWDSAGLAAARVALAAQTKLARSFMIIGDVPNSTFAGYVVTAANAYETANDRFVVARASVADRLPLPRKSRVAGETLTFAEVGSSGDTVTRSAGSWIADGFAVGDTVKISGASLTNNVTGSIAGLTATVLTFGMTDLMAEVIDSDRVSVEKVQTMAAWVSAKDAAFDAIDGERRVDLALGRARKLSPITGWSFRRSAAWAASIREYSHDVHVPCWRKTDGPLSGWDMTDGEGNVVEFDERTDGGGLAGRFTCLRTYGNGPSGAFVALAMTRASEGSLLSRTHNMAVANVACAVSHAETEASIGQVLQLNDDGTATAASLQVIEERVNTALQRNLLQDKGEGPRASSAVWRASKSDVLNVPGASLTGTLDLRLNGTLEQIATRVRVL